MSAVDTPDLRQPGAGAPPGLQPTTLTTLVTREMDVPLGSPTRPSWRGRLHLIALLSAVPMLVLRASGDRLVSPRALQPLPSAAQVLVLAGPHLLLQRRTSACIEAIDRFVHFVRERG